MKPTYKEMMLEMKNILQEGLEDVRHEIRAEYQKAINPLIKELSEIRITVTRIDERQKLISMFKWTATIVSIGIISGGVWLYNDAVDRIAIVQNQKQDKFVQSNLK